MTHLAWTPDQIATLERMYEDGAYASEIGEVLGVTKNSVLGKAHKLGLKSKNPPSLNKHRQDKALPSNVAKKAKRRTKPRQEAPPNPAPAAAGPAPVRIGILDLKRRHCRWPLGDPRHEDFGFCGARRAVDSSYCAYHRKIAGYVSSKAVTA